MAQNVIPQKLSELFTFAKDVADSLVAWGGDFGNCSQLGLNEETSHSRPREYEFPKAMVHCSTSAMDSQSLLAPLCEMGSRRRVAQRVDRRLAHSVGGSMDSGSGMAPATGLPWPALM